MNTLKLFIYVAILRAYWSKISAKLFKRVQPHGTVTIKIYPTDNLYTIVARYAYKHGSKKENMTNSVAQYSDIFDARAVCYSTPKWYDGTYDNDDDEDENNEDEPIKVNIKPREYPILAFI
jgi:hypothetical protein